MAKELLCANIFFPGVDDGDVVDRHGSFMQTVLAFFGNGLGTFVFSVELRLHICLLEDVKVGGSLTVKEVLFGDLLFNGCDKIPAVLTFVKDVITDDVCRVCLND